MERRPWGRRIDFWNAKAFCSQRIDSLERRQGYKGALEAYSESLQVEWNQPPIIASRQRLQRPLPK